MMPGQTRVRDKGGGSAPTTRIHGPALHRLGLRKAKGIVCRMKRVGVVGL